MKPTIRNKLMLGFAGVLVLISAVAGIGAYAVFSLRASAYEATRVGGQLNAYALEVQVHNLAAQRGVRAFLDNIGKLGFEQAKATYLEGATFEVSEMRGLAERAAKIAPTAERKDRFTKILSGIDEFQGAIDRVIGDATKSGGRVSDEQLAVYLEKADRLNERAEDGEVTGKEASQMSFEDIDRVSSRSVTLVIVFAIVGLISAIVVGHALSKAILNPVEHLKDVAENVSLGNLDIAVRRYSDDEMGDLADSFSRMVTAVKFFRMESSMAQEEVGPEGGN